MKYCPICGNFGITPFGDPCTCGINADPFSEEISCLDIPEQYRGISFTDVLVPKDIDNSYRRYLADVHLKVTTGRWQSHNVVIASPIGHSKTILAYSCIQSLFKNGSPTFPLYDVLELKRIMVDMDLCRNQIYDVENPELIVTVPVLFVRIPRITEWEIYNTISLILDRRVRRGNSTIFLYNGTWNQLIRSDKNDILSGLMGDGNFSTLEVKSWSVLSNNRGIEVPDNLG